MHAVLQLAQVNRIDHCTHFLFSKLFLHHIYVLVHRFWSKISATDINAEVCYPADDGGVRDHCNGSSIQYHQVI